MESNELDEILDKGAEKARFVADKMVQKWKRLWVLAEKEIISSRRFIPNT